jgi:membrane-associated phospholipid phosphatase
MKRRSPGQRRGLRLTLLTIAFALLAIAFGLLLSRVLSKGPLVQVDAAAASHLHEWVLQRAIGQSFPSGHAMNSTIAYGALLLIFLPALRPAFRSPVIAAAVVLVGVIGFTRLALGVHYISDVLGGFVLGAAWLSASTAVFRPLKRRL